MKCLMKCCLRFQLMRGQLIEANYEKEIGLLRATIEQEKKPHFDEFLGYWK